MFFFFVMSSLLHTNWTLSYHSDGVLSHFLCMQPNSEASASLFTLVSTAGNDARFLVQDMRRQTAKGADVNWANAVHDQTHIHIHVYVHVHVRDAILCALSSVQSTHVIKLFHRNYQQMHRTAVCATRLRALLLFCLDGCICLIGLQQSHAIHHHHCWNATCMPHFSSCDDAEGRDIFNECYAFGTERHSGCSHQRWGRCQPADEGNNSSLSAIQRSSPF